MRNLVRSGWVSTILIVLSWILLLLIAFFYIPGSNEGTHVVRLGANTPSSNFPKNGIIGNFDYPGVQTGPLQ